MNPVRRITRMRIYLVVEIGSPDAGWPVSVFSTQERALFECKRLAGKKKMMDEKIFPEVEGFVVRKNKSGNPGYLVYAKGKKGPDCYGHGFEVEEYILDKLSDDYL